MGTGASISSGQPQSAHPAGDLNPGQPSVTHTMDEPLSIILAIQAKGGINKISNPKDPGFEESQQDRLDFSIAVLEVLEVIYQSLPDTPQLRLNHPGQDIVDCISSLMTMYTQLLPAEKDGFRATLEQNRPEAFLAVIDALSTEQDQDLHPHAVIEGKISRQSSSSSKDRAEIISTSTAMLCRFIKNYCDAKDKPSVMGGTFTVDKSLLTEFKNKTMDPKIRNLDQFREQLTVFPLELCFVVDPVNSSLGQDLGVLQPKFNIGTSTHVKVPPFKNELKEKAVIIHNHPRQGPLSHKDLTRCIDKKAKEIQAVTLNKTYRAEIINTPNIPYQDLAKSVNQLLVQVHDNQNVKQAFEDKLDLIHEYSLIEIRESHLHLLEIAGLINFHGTCKEFPEPYISRFNLLK
ncbi:hypothetical protein HOH87_05555 [bacterium]|jgi:hypothetical protein|nr:hypothetical protein [bacterium]